MTTKELMDAAIKTVEQMTQEEKAKLRQQLSVKHSIRELKSGRWGGYRSGKLVSQFKDGATARRWLVKQRDIVKPVDSFMTALSGFRQAATKVKREDDLMNGKLGSERVQ